MRRRLSTAARLALFRAHGGRCHLCGEKIWPGQRWDVSHLIALELGGPDTADNLAPAHRKCHAWQTRMVDLPAIAKAKRIEARHVGAAVARRPLPCGRDSAFRKKIDGTVVPRSPAARHP